MDGQLRVSDVDRENVMARLEVHCAAGRLSLDELLERTEAARTAVTRTELAAALHDLPPDAAAATESEPGPAGWRDRVWRVHASVAALTSGAVIGLWQATRDPTPAPQDYGVDYWWPLWFALAWGVVVLLHLVYASGFVRLPPRPFPTARIAPAPDAPATAPPPALPTAAPAPAAPPAPAERLAALTERERETLALVAQGYANKEIARQLFISERTARTHVSNILRKLDLPSRTQAALFAVRAGLAPSPPTAPSSNTAPPADD